MNQKGLFLIAALLHPLVTGCRTAADPIVLDDSAPGTDQPLRASSWLGNTFPGDADKRAVPRTIADIFVVPDGTVYSLSRFRGGGDRAVVWKGGQGGAERVGRFPASFAGGGHSLTVDGNFVYLDESRGDPQRISRASLDGTEAGTFLLPMGADVHGLAVSGTYLLVSNQATDEILIYDLNNTAAPIRRLALPRPGELASGSGGLVWAIQEKPVAALVPIDTRTWQILAARTLRGLVDPRDVAIDSKGRLWVAESGPDYQLKIFRSEGTGAPTADGTFGIQGGIFADVPGLVAPLKLNQPNAVGVDAAGNVYVNHGMNGLGARVEAYAPTGERLWEISSVGAVYDSAGLDPGSEGDVYGKAFRFKIDFSRNGVGDFRYVGFTEGTFVHDRVPPEDPKEKESPLSTTLGVRRVAGRPFVFVTQSAGHAYLAVYRQMAPGKSELLAPCAMIMKRGGGSWPPGAPKRESPWLWRDLNGDGRFTADEYGGVGFSAPLIGEDWGVDDTGGIWVNAGGAPANLLHLKPNGLDSHGCLSYPASGHELIATPAPFDTTGAQSASYIPTTDTMILSGYTAAAPRPSGAGSFDGGYAGRVAARYDNFRDPVKRKKIWETPFPWEIAPGRTPHNVSLAGRYLFVGYADNQVVRVLDTQNEGAVLATFTPEAPIIGTFDNGEVVAARRANGEYVAFMDEGLYRKVVIYRWHPGAPQSVGARLSASDNPTTAAVALTWTKPIEGSPTGYLIYRSKSGLGHGYTRVAGPMTDTRWTDPAAPRGGRISYRVAAVSGGAAPRLFSYETAVDVP